MRLPAGGTQAVPRGPRPPERERQRFRELGVVLLLMHLGLGLVGVYIPRRASPQVPVTLSALGVTAELCGAGSEYVPPSSRRKHGVSGQAPRPCAQVDLSPQPWRPATLPSVQELLTRVLSSEQKGERG